MNEVQTMTAMIEHVMQIIPPQEIATLDDVLRTDALARGQARDWLAAQQ